MTPDLPDTLMRKVKIRAAAEGLKLQELIADFVKQGLERPPATTLPEGGAHGISTLKQDSLFPAH